MSYGHNPRIYFILNIKARIVYTCLQLTSGPTPVKLRRRDRGKRDVPG